MRDDHWDITVQYKVSIKKYREFALSVLWQLTSYVCVTQGDHIWWLFLPCGRPCSSLAQNQLTSWTVDSGHVLYFTSSCVWGLYYNEEYSFSADYYLYWITEFQRLSRPLTILNNILQAVSDRTSWNRHKWLSSFGLIWQPVIFSVYDVHVSVSYISFLFLIF